jgi:uroporphyrin-III C-methyltransferase/precorrin-2 dehydrogenase/sirohydrochlorin ferrochelatase
MCPSGCGEHAVTPSLPLFHRVAGQPVIVLGTGEVAQARRRLVERAGGRVVDDLARGIAEGARLAFIADTDQPDADARVDVGRLRAAGVLVNVADQPALCDFIVPAVVDRAPVLVAVGTGGASAGLAKALRLRLEALLPPGLGALAWGLHEARAALRTRFPDAGDRRRALDAALGEGGALDPLREGAGVAAWLDGAAAGEEARVVEIRLRSANPEDLTLREARLLGSADIIAHEPGVPSAVLARARADAGRQEIAPGASAAMVKGLVIVLRHGG